MSCFCLSLCLFFSPSHARRSRLIPRSLCVCRGSWRLSFFSPFPFAFGLSLAAAVRHFPRSPLPTVVLSHITHHEVVSLGFLFSTKQKTNPPPPAHHSPSMSTPAAASAAPAADAAASKPQASTEARPGKEGLADVSREVTSEVTADGMRIESNWCVNRGRQQQQAQTNAPAEQRQRRGLRGAVRCRPSGQSLLQRSQSFGTASMPPSLRAHG